MLGHCVCTGFPKLSTSCNNLVDIIRLVASGVARISGQGGPKKIRGGHLKQDKNGKKETK